MEEACYSLIIIEHDPILYEDSLEMVEYVSKAMKRLLMRLDVAILAWDRSFPRGPSQEYLSGVLLRGGASAHV